MENHCAAPLDNTYCATHGTTDMCQTRVGLMLPTYTTSGTKHIPVDNNLILPWWKAWTNAIWDGKFNADGIHFSDMAATGHCGQKFSAVQQNPSAFDSNVIADLINTEYKGVHTDSVARFIAPNQNWTNRCSQGKLCTGPNSALVNSDSSTHLAGSLTSGDTGSANFPAAFQLIPNVAEVSSTFTNCQAGTNNEYYHCTNEDIGRIQTESEDSNKFDVNQGPLILTEASTNFVSTNVAWRNKGWTFGRPTNRFL